MGNPRSIQLHLVGSLFFSLSTPALAQPQEIVLDPVVVTASRLDQPRSGDHHGVKNDFLLLRHSRHGKRKEQRANPMQLNWAWITHRCSPLAGQRPRWPIRNVKRQGRRSEGKGGAARRITRVPTAASRNRVACFLAGLRADKS